MGAKDLNRVDRGVYTALGIGCVYSIASVSYTHLSHPQSQQLQNGVDGGGLAGAGRAADRQRFALFQRA